MKLKTVVKYQAFKPLVTSAFAVMLVILISAPFGYCQEAAIKDRRISIAMENVGFGDVIGYLSSKYGLSFGVEMAPADYESNDLQFDVYRGDFGVFGDKRTKFKLDLKDAQLSEVLDAVMAFKPDYRWEISNETINIYPIRGRDERLSRLMNLKIGSFDLGKNNLIVGKIVDRVVALSEVREFARSEDLGIPALHYGDATPLFDKMEDIHLSKLSFKELLNKLALAKKGGWRVFVTPSTDKTRRDVVVIEI